MPDEKLGHLIRLPLDAIDEPVEAEPRVTHCKREVQDVLNDLYTAVDMKSYIPATPTPDNPALSDDYIFDDADEALVLKDLKMDNFVGKIRDLSKGAQKRKAKGYPDEYLYVFKYACRLIKRDSPENKTEHDTVLIYIKINDRKVPYKKLFVISFHKNRPKL